MVSTKRETVNEHNNFSKNTEIKREVDNLRAETFLKFSVSTVLSVDSVSSLEPESELFVLVRQLENSEYIALERIDKPSFHFDEPVSVTLTENYKTDKLIDENEAEEDFEFFEPKDPKDTKYIKCDITKHDHWYSLIHNSCERLVYNIHYEDLLLFTRVEPRGLHRTQKYSFSVENNRCLDLAGKGKC